MSAARGLAKPSIPATSVTRLPRQSEAPEKHIPELPISVNYVLNDIQNRLLQVKGVFASVYALAEHNDDSGDVRYALEAALELFESTIESVEPISIRREAAQREVHHG